MKTKIINGYKVHIFQTDHGVLWLPRDHLSSSSVDLWEKHQQGFIEKYFEDGGSFDTMYTLFGKKVHKKIEIGKMEVDGHKAKQGYKFEQYIKVYIDGVPVIGYIDIFHKWRKAITDVKTGLVKDSSGKPSWTPSKVHGLKQLPFYTMLVEEKFGYYQKTVRLVWLMSEEYEEAQKIESMGMELYGHPTKKLRLTGESKVFKREIYPREVEEQRSRVIRVAQEISDVFRAYIHKNVKSE